MNSTSPVLLSSTAEAAFPLAAGCRLLAKAILLMLLACGMLHSPSVLAQNVWTGSAGTTNWSTPGNWSWGTPPASADPVLFDNTSPAPSGVVDNIVDADFTINTLTYSALGTVGYHTTWINPGLSLNIQSDGGAPLSVGTGTALTAADNVYWRVLGNGTLTVTNTSGAIYVVQVGSAADHYATLDLSGLTNFVADVDQLLVGAFTFSSGLLRPMGIMRLAETNFIHTAAGTTKPGIMVAAYPGSDTNVRGTQQLFLGRHNMINADVISMGGHKSTGQILFRSGLTGGYASIRGSAGGADKVKVLTIGDPRARIADMTGGGTSVASTGTFNTSGNFLDLSVTDLFVARSQTSGTGNSTGTLTFDDGIVDADNLYIGYHTPGTTTAANATGTLNVNGTATVTVNNDLVMANKVGTSTPVATLNLAANGTVNVKNNIVTGGGTSTINFNNGGMINMQPAGDTSAGSVTIGTIAGSGTITNAANVTVNTALTPGGALTAGTLAIGGNLTLASSAAANFTLGSAFTIGGGVNDWVSVAGDLNLSSNVVTIVPAAVDFAAGSYRLFDFTGTRSGYLTWTNPTRYIASLDYPANQVNLIVTGGAAGNVRWNTANSAVWDLSTSNWFNTGSAAADRFCQMDNVLVDDSGAYTNLLLLSTAVFPGTVTVNSSSLNYIFGGSSGRISGGATLIKQGTSSLTVSNANDFLGPVLISAGTLRTANAAALGATNSGTTVASSATLDLYGSSLYSPGDVVTISGTGVGGLGAVINSGADVQNGIRYLALADNASIGNSNGRWDVRGPGGSGTFSGGLYLNGFTLTKIGSGKNSLVDSMITNAGSIVVSSGTLGLTRSILDGPGTIVGAGTNVIQIENSSTGYIAKPLIFTDGGSTFQVTGNAFTLYAPVTNAGGLTIDNAVALTLTNVFTGAGALTKSSAGTLTFQAPALHTGPTTISAGRVTLSTNASMAATPSIAVATGASFDASAIPGGFALASGQTLSGSGSILGDVTAGSGATLVPGTSAGTLTFSNNLTLNSCTNVIELGSDPTQVGGGVNDLIAVSSNLTLSGVVTIKIIPTGPLDASTAYTVMIASNSLSAGAATFQVLSDNPRYTFSVVNPAQTGNTIQVAVSGVPTTLVWKGGQAAKPNAWDTSTLNWLNGAAADVFFSGDNVQFDDTATTSLVTLSSTLQPGAVTVNNATRSYTFGDTGGLNGGSLTKQGGAGLAFTNNGPVNFSAGVTVGGGSVTFANGSANILGGALTINGGSVTFANPAANTFGPNILLEAGSLAFNQPTDITLATSISNTVPLTAGTLVKQGNNTLLLSGNNANFDGPITVSGGMLRAGNASALGSTNAGTTIAGGATFDINGYQLYAGDILTIAGAGLNSTGAVINTGAAQNNAVHGIVLSADATIGSWGNRWDIRGPEGNNGTFSGLLDLAGRTLTKVGAGRVSLVDATITSPGTINIAAGLFAMTRCSVEGEGAINLSTNILYFENYSAGYCNKPLTADGGIIRVGGNALTLGSSITNLAGGFTADLTNNLTLQGPVTGAGGITKINAAGSLILGGANSFAGPVILNAGVVQLANNEALGTNGRVIAHNTTGTTGGAGVVVDVAGGVQVPPGVTVILNTTNSPDIRSSARGSGGGSEWQGTIIPAGDGRTAFYADGAGTELIVSGLVTNTTFDGTLFIRGGSGYGRISGHVGLGAGSRLFKTDAGTWIIATNGHTWGTTTIAVGTLRLETNDALCVTAPLTMGQSDANTATFDLNGFNQSVPALSSTGTGLRQIGNDSVSADSVFTYAGGTNVSNYGGQLIDALTASGLYKLALTVASGTLYLNGSNSFTGPTLVQNGGTLGGTGSLFSEVTVQSGGTLSPGASVGALTISSNLTFAAGSTCLVEVNLDTPANDQVIGLSNVVFAGTLVITNVGSTPFSNGTTLKLFDAQSYSGSFAIQPPTPGPGLAWVTTNLTVNGTLAVASGGVPTVPTNITAVVSGNTLVLSWPESYKGWRLQGQTNSLSVGLSGQWYDVAGASATNRVVLPINPANGAAFYRMVYP